MPALISVRIEEAQGLLVSVSKGVVHSSAMKRKISVAEAQKIVLAAAPRLGCETLSFAQAQGRVLGEPITSARTLPPADNSAMDGYALRAADLEGASEATPCRLPVAFEVPAGGAASRPLASGEVARIFTGAPVPPGADAVVEQEIVEVEGDHASFRVAVELGNHIRRAGEDVRAGDVVLEPGALLGPGQIGLMVQQPRGALLSSGDELVEPDGDPAGGKIVSSNSYSLAAQCRELGIEPTYVGIAADTPESVEEHLRAGLFADVLITSAGVSVGDHDYVRPLLEKLGCQLLFWGVRMKPGFPVTFGRFEPDRGPLVFGLPGNPVSAMVCFEQFVRPALRSMMGHRDCFRATIDARLAHSLAKKPGRLNFVRVCLERRGDEIWASSTGTQSSGALRSMALAQGLLIFPSAAEVLEEGALVQVQVLAESLLTSGGAVEDR